MSPSPGSAIAAAAGAPAAAIRSAGPSSGGELEREEELERVSLTALSMPSDDRSRLRRYGRLPI